MDRKYDFQKIAKKLNKYLDSDRMWHTLGVMHTAASMAMHYGYPVEKAQLAGLLHDCAKCIPTGKKLKLCKKNEIPVTSFELEHPFLLHAKLGAWIAKEKYEVTDDEVLQAITWHTTGRPDMTTLDKIIYIADYIEPARNKAPRLQEIRKLAFEDLDVCMYEILSDTLQYLEEDPDAIDQMSKDAYEFYKKAVSEQSKGEKNDRI